MRNQNPKNIIMNLAENYKPLLRYNERENFGEWQKTAREKLCELLGLDLIPDCNDDLEIVSVTKCDGYEDTYFSFQGEQGFYVPCHILKPENSKENLPVVICIQGHSTGMHISIGTPKYEGDEDDITSGDRDYARIAVKKGYCAIAIEQRYMGECGGTEKGTGCQNRPVDGINALPTLLFGRTAIGERVHDVMKLTDIVTSGKYELFNCINPEDILITGNSGGGTTSFYAACVDERIKYAVASCCFCTYKDSIIDISHCGCNYIPSVARYFDMGDLVGLIAPRGLVLVAGEKDKIFPLNGVKKAYITAKYLYKTVRAEDKIELVIGDGGHRYYVEKAFKALDNMR